MSWQVEGFLFVLTLPFVAYSGSAFTKLWFTRLDDFDKGIPGPVAPSSALALELRQRQLVAVLSRVDPSYIKCMAAADMGGFPGPAASTGGGPDGPVGATAQGTATITTSTDSKGVRVGVVTNLTMIDCMYEQAMASPMCGPLLRLFLAQYIRCVCSRQPALGCSHSKVVYVCVHVVCGGGGGGA